MLRRIYVPALGLLLLAALLAGCKPVTAPANASEPAAAGATPQATPEATPEAAAEATAEAAQTGAAIGMPNPASVFCADNGGKLQIRDETGGQAGYCLFDDGSECEEWAYLRGECTAGEVKAGKAQPAAPIGMPNPASVFCTEHAGKLEIRQDKSGGEYGMCVFSDSSECEEWAYFRGECAPGGPRSDANLPNPASANCVAMGGTLHMEHDESGGEYGMCALAGGHECEEWALLRGTCQADE